MKAALWLLPWLAVGPAVAQPALVRLGNHANFGRVVFEFAQSQTFAMERSGNALVLRFPGAGDIPDGTGSARNILAVTGGGQLATLTIAPTARVKALSVGNRVVVDVFDQTSAKSAANTRSGVPVATAQMGPSAFHDRPEPQPLAAAVIPPLTPATSPAIPDRPVTPAQALPVHDAQPTPSIAASTTLAISVTQRPPPANTVGAGVVLPFDASVGAAAFQRGDEAWLVFDDRRPLDIQGLHSNPLFSAATVELLPSATLVRLKNPIDRRLRLDRQAEGWLMQFADKEQTGQAQMPTISPSRLLFPAPQAGHVVVVADPETGRNLLVGTLQTSGPGVPMAVRTPEFTVMPSWQGLVVEPVSDRTTMRPLPQGFAVETGGSLSLSLDNGSGLASTAVLTRRFDLPGDPVPTLLRRLQAQTQDEGQAPAQSRLMLRKAAAQTMLALGLGVEAQSLLRLAMSEDPRAASDPDLNGLAGIAAVVSGRPLEAGGLDAAGLAGTDDVTLWRAARAAMIDGRSPEAAQAFSATAGLVLSYPTALRNRLLPVAVETMVAGGASNTADALLSKLGDEPLLAFARAARLEQKGDTSAALTLYDALAGGRDRLASTRAATRAILLRLAAGSMSPREAADTLTRKFSNWRGDARERELRLKTAEIQAEAGLWRDAFTTLRDTAQLFEADAPAIHARAAALLDQMLHGPGAAAIEPLDLVSLAEENADVIAKAGNPNVASLLADKLMALDLPDRAGSVIQRMITSLPNSVNRAALGARLASMRLASGQTSAAAAALVTTASAELPPDLTEERGLLQAQIAIANHDVAGAAAILEQIGTAAAGELRAKVLGADGDWRGAALALAKVVLQTVPQNGSLTSEQQDLVLRLASAQARAGDEAALHKLANENGSRMLGAHADMFRLLTSAPVTAVTDLRRSGQELAMIHDLPAAMITLGKR